MLDHLASSYVHLVYLFVCLFVCLFEAFTCDGRINRGVCFTDLVGISFLDHQSHSCPFSVKPATRADIVDVCRRL